MPHAVEVVRDDPLKCGMDEWRTLSPQKLSHSKQQFTHNVPEMCPI